MLKHKNANYLKNTSAPSTSFRRRLLRDERGLSSVEYVILMVVVIVGAMEAWKRIGKEVTTGLGNSQEAMEKLNSDSTEGDEVGSGL